MPPKPILIVGAGPSGLNLALALTRRNVQCRLISETYGPSPSREILSFSFKEIGAGLSPYPSALVYPQDDHERFLIEKLWNAGCNVDWSAKITGFREHENGVRSTIEHRTCRLEETESSYICSCNGARSCLRETLYLPFLGRTDDQLFFVAE